MLSQSTQEKRLHDALQRAGDRYDSSITVEIERLDRYLDVVSRSGAFQKKIIQKIHKNRGDIEFGGLAGKYQKHKKEIESLQTQHKKLIKRINALKDKPRDERVLWSTLIKSFDEILDESVEIERKLTADFKGEDRDTSTTRDYESAMHHFRSDLYRLRSEFGNSEQDLFNKPRMLLSGEAGIGKTHALCEFAETRIQSKKNTLIFLASELVIPTTKDPISAMAKLLGLSRRGLLKAVEATSAKSDEKTCIIVDAINEGEGIDWSKLEEFKKIKGVTLIVSVRDGYEFLIKDKSTYVQVAHTGFADITWDALPRFFEFYKLKMPDFPMLDPEFRNPLFLKLFCQAYTGNKKTPRGHGATHLFEIYVEKQSKKVLAELGFSRLKSDYLWWNVIKEIAIWMGRNSKQRILRSKLESIINADTNLNALSSQVIVLMERHALLLKTPHYTRSGKRSGYEYSFTYHRFSDHLIVRSLLTENNIQGANASKQARRYLGSSNLVENLLGKHLDPGLIEALCIQIPERCKGDELVWMIPANLRSDSTIKKGFIEGLKWRDVSKKSKDGKSLAFVNEQQTVNYMNHYLSSNEYDLAEVISLMLDVCSIPLHPFNAERLSLVLSNQPFPEREKMWQEYMSLMRDEGDAIDRLHSWSLSSLPESLNLSNESVSLASIALVWTLASTNRFVRDRSTRSLIALLKDRQDILGELIEDFWENEDEYIVERLLSVAVGCFHLNKENKGDFKKVVDFLYTNHFKAKKRRFNALIDDHASMIILHYKRLHWDGIMYRKAVIVPPYKYSFPKRFPTISYLERLYRDENSDYGSIWQSLMYGQAAIADFGNYTLGYTAGQFSNVRIDEKPPRSPKNPEHKFSDGLNEQQYELLRDYRASKFSRHIGSDLKIYGLNPAREKKSEISEEEIQQDIENKLRKFEKSLGPIKRLKYRKAKPYITGELFHPNSRVGDYDLAKARRWMFKRVVNLGWSPELHLEYERIAARDRIDRSEKKRTERIGKKYQWIALHNFVALLGSNYFISDKYGPSEDNYKPYRSAVDANIRDIDPTIPPRWLLKEVVEKDKDDSSWWRHEYNAWDTENWQFSSHDVPSAKSIIQRTWNGKKMLSLYNMTTWYRPQSPYEDEEKSYQTEQLWMHAKAYVVRRKDWEKAKEWLSDKEFWNHTLPDSNDESGGLYMTEVYESSSNYTRFFEAYAFDWVEEKNERPFKLMMPTERYTSGHFDSDASIDDVFSFYTPNRTLRKKFDIKPGDIPGVHLDKHGNVAFIDPLSGTDERGHYLFVDAERLSDYLDRNNLNIFWSILGEKIDMSPKSKDQGRDTRFEIHGFCYLDKGEITEVVRHKNSS